MITASAASGKNCYKWQLNQNSSETDAPGINFQLRILQMEIDSLILGAEV